MMKISEFDRQCLDSIHAPRPVAVPPVNATRELMKLPDGSLRHYDTPEHDLVSSSYLGSNDNGLSWKRYPSAEGSPGAVVQSPWSGDFLTIRVDYSNKERLLFRSTDGVDGVYSRSVIGEGAGLINSQPLALRQRKRWLLPLQERRSADEATAPALMLSDDDGATWRKINLPAMPVMGIEPPHKGLRWINCGPEPTVVELTSGRLMMVLRTAMDFYYHSFSEDGGENWSTAEPSPFYGTITSPNLFRMASGRLIFFGNFTRPLPELEHAQIAGLNDVERSGLGEDVFTNRDVLHAALSDDEGRSWHGFREIWLNPRRNDADFRVSGGRCGSLDRSVHQSQAVELPGGKVLVACGQHPRCRRMLIFDPAWLFEKERQDDFSRGLVDWTVHQYVESRLGNWRGPHSGHCSYNRRAGAALVPSPLEFCEALQVARFSDPRLIEERQGALWNFPMAAKGRLEIEFIPQRGAAGTLIMLHDQWFNASDTVACDYAALLVELTAAGSVGPFQVLFDERNTLLITWEGWQGGACYLHLNGSQAAPLTLRRVPLHGINYLHLQSAATVEDQRGLLLCSVKAQVLAGPPLPSVIGQPVARLRREKTMG